MSETVHVQEVVGDATTTDRQLVVSQALLPGADGDGYSVTQTVVPGAGYTFVVFTPGGTDATREEVEGDADTAHCFLAADTRTLGAVPDGADLPAFSLPHAGGGTVLVLAVPTP